MQTRGLVEVGLLEKGGFQEKNVSKNTLHEEEKLKLLKFLVKTILYPHSTGYCNTCCMKRLRGKLCSSCDRTPEGRYDLQAYDRGRPQADPPLASGRRWTARDCSALGASGEQHQQGAFPQHRRPGLPSKAGARAGAKAGSAAGAASVHG